MTPETVCGYWDKMKTCQVAMADLTDLPSYHRQTIPKEYMDRMGHMNVRYYMANQDTNMLAAIIESLITHANLKFRKAAPLPSETADRFRSRLNRDQKLDWESPVSGVLQ
jgi:hypothetical protein